MNVVLVDTCYDNQKRSIGPGHSEGRSAENIFHLYSVNNLSTGTGATLLVLNVCGISFYTGEHRIQ